VAWLASSRTNRACHQVGPVRDVPGGITHDGGLSRRTARGMQTSDLLGRHGKQPERIVVTEVFLQEKRKAAQILERSQVIGMNPLRRERPSIVFNVVISVSHGPLEPLQLDGT